MLLHFGLAREGSGKRKISGLRSEGSVTQKSWEGGNKTERKVAEKREEDDVLYLAKVGQLDGSPEV